MSHAPGLPDRSRRALLRGRLRPASVLRPPWALDAARFAAACRGDCAAACPEGAFAPVHEAPWSLRATVGEACLAVRGIVCMSCRDACGDAAIRFPPTHAVPRPRVDADRCTGCGACVGACPAGAISLAAAAALEVPLGA